MVAPKFGLTMKVKEQFFDRAAVIRDAGATAARALSRAGSFIRRRAQTSMRRRKKVSEAGSPPSAHEGSLRKLIFFGYDTAAKSVVIGPIVYRKGEAPQLNEFGGTTTRKDRHGKLHTLTYRARPFMGPALEKEVASLPDHWAASVRNSA